MPVHAPIKGAPARKPGKVTTGGAVATKKALRPNMGDPNSKVSSGGSKKATPSGGRGMGGY